MQGRRHWRRADRAEVDLEREWRDMQTHSIELRPRRADETLEADTYIGRLEIPKVALWWPHTHGEPELYSARLQVRLRGSSEAVVADLGRVGFRTVTLHTRNGEFALHINGVPIFCRGACWTPLDPVSLNAPVDMLRATLAQVRSAGMNMLRIGGMSGLTRATTSSTCAIPTASCCGRTSCSPT